MSTEVVEIVIPSSPADRKELFDAIKQCSNSMTRAESESEYQKETYETLEKKFGIKAKYLRRMAVDYHKDQFDKKANEQDEYSNLYEQIVRSTSSSSSASQADLEDLADELLDDGLEQE